MNINQAHYYLNSMGIQPWILRQRSAENISTPNVDWESLEKCVKNCVACGLHKTRTQTVFGSGNRQADLMIIGEAPGATEDKMGLPFVGRAGQLLDEMLFSIGFQREQIFIGNVLKCRPPNNRDPSPEEIAQCMPFLEQQVQAVKPQLILALGRIAAHALLKSNDSLGSLRGKSFTFGTSNIPLLISYHPAYLLRSPREKKKAYQDLLTVFHRLKKQQCYLKR